MNYYLISKTLKRAFIIMSSFLILWSCSKPIDTLSSDNELHLFYIPNALVSIFQKTAFVTVDQGTDLTSLVPTITSGEGALFFIDDQPIVSAETKVDLSKVALLTIQAEDGSIKNYHICVKEGNKNIDSKVYSVMKKYDIPGISISATRDEKMVYSYGFGFANTSTYERVTPKHLFRLASMTKSQTTLCLMTLMERGQLKITDRMFGEGGLFEKEFGTDLVFGAETITIQNFLEHTSGWADEHIFTYSDSPLEGKDIMGRMNYILHNVPLDYDPGTTYAYYNMGFGILGKLVEKLSGKDYESFLREDVYAKCGVTDIWVGGDEYHRRPNEVVYYSQDGTNGYGNDMQLINSLGGLIASTEELMKVMASIDYLPNVPDIFTKETLDIMYTPSEAIPHRYALGWRTNSKEYTNWKCYHGGNLAGTGTLWCRDKNNAAVVILCNSRSYISGFDDALYELLDNILRLI